MCAVTLIHQGAFEYADSTPATLSALAQQIQHDLGLCQSCQMFLFPKEMAAGEAGSTSEF